MTGEEATAPERYEILARIAEGGSGAVYKAKDRETGGTVAFKVLFPPERSDRGQTGRFLREAGVIAALDHPSIAAVLDHGIHRGRPFLVMDFIDGLPLHRVLRRGPLPEKTALRISLRLAETLEYIHSRDIIHRDLKPSNIMLRKGGEPVIVDFGFMKSYAEDFLLEESGVTLGTPAYMAPELVEGDLQKTDERTDIFSLGAVLYETLTGERPFPALEPERVFRQILRMRPAPPRQIRPDLSEHAEKVCLRCLEKKPSKRYPNAKALSNALGRILLTGRL